MAPGVAHLYALPELPLSSLSIVVQGFDYLAVPDKQVFSILGGSEMILYTVVIVLREAEVQAIEQVHQWPQSYKSSMLIIQLLKRGEQLLF